MKTTYNGTSLPRILHVNSVEVMTKADLAVNFLPQDTEG